MIPSRYQTFIVSFSRCCSRISTGKGILTNNINFAQTSSIFTSSTGGWHRLLLPQVNKNSFVDSRRLFLKPSRHFCNTNSSIESMVGMELQQVVSNLKTHAPISLAQSWDNVGLLVEPSSPHIVRTLFLTNDLTPPVLTEAIEKKADMILAYHPPIFSAMKRLRQSVWKERLMVKCIENKIAVYSPHTCYDAKSTGVNDWLISAFDVQELSTIDQTEETPGKLTHKVNITCSANNELKSAISSLDVKVTSSQVFSSSNENIQLYSILCTSSDLPHILKVVEKIGCQIDSLDVVKLEKVPKIGNGSGRVGKLKSPITVSEAVDRIKTHLQLKHVRLAAKPSNKPIESVAVCAGSGSSVLRGVRADLYVTGEMSHHDVLDAVYNGANVILCEHSNTERGYLKQVKEELSKTLTDVSIVISDIDTDPLHIV